MTRLALLVLLAGTGCLPSQRATLVPGSDMALPRAPGLALTKKNGEICGTGSIGGIGASGVGVIVGDALDCSPLAPDSTRRPPKPPNTP